MDDDCIWNYYYIIFEAYFKILWIRFWTNLWISFMWILSQSRVECLFNFWTKTCVKFT